MTNVLLVALGGAFGAVARYAVGRLTVRLWPGTLPLATWAVNLLGCLLIGLAVPLLARTGIAEGWRFFCVAGFLGAFTTFSTYSLETVVLWQGGFPAVALANALGSMAAGLLCVLAGMWLGRLLL